MKRHAATALAVALALALPVAARAQSTQSTTSYFGTLNVVNPPYSSVQSFIFNNGADLALAPGNVFATIDGAQTLTHKIFDCAVNTCSNFPGGGGGGVSTNGSANDILTSNGLLGFGTPITPTTGVATLLGAFSSTNLLAALGASHTGTGLAVFGTSPVLTTPDLGTPSAANLLNGTNLPIGSTTGTLAFNRLAVTGSPTGSKFVRDDGVLAIPAGGGGGVSAGAAGNIQISSDGAGGFGSFVPGAGVTSLLTTFNSANLLTALGASHTGTGSVAFGTSPTFTTPNLGTPSAAVLTSATGLPVGGIASIAANSVVMNATGGSASPTAVAMAACADTGGNHLNYTAGAFLCGTSGGSGTLTITDTHGFSLGSVTSVAAGPGFIASGSAGAVTIKPTNEITTSATASYAITTADANTTVHLTHATPTPSIQASATLGSGYGVSVQCDNACTLTPLSGTINGAASLVLAAHQTAAIWTDGSTTSAGIIPATDPSNAANLIGGTVAVARLGSSGTRDSTTVLHGDNTWSAPAGSGTVNGGTANQIAYYAGTGAAVSGNSHLTDDGTTVKLTQAVALSGVVLDTIAGDQNDYAPSGIGTASTLMIDGGTANRTITGITTGVDGRILTVINNGTTNNLVFSNLVTSSAANQFSTDADTSVPPGGSITFKYIAGAVNKWKGFGRTHQTVDYVVGWAAGVSPNKFIAFRAPRAMIITGIVGTVGDAVGTAATMTVRKVPSGTTCASGTALHTSTFNANGTAATDQTLSLSATVSDLQLAVGDRVCLDLDGTSATNMAAGVGTGVVTVSARAR